MTKELAEAVARLNNQLANGEIPDDSPDCQLITDICLLLSAVASLPAREWQPIDTAPEDKEVLVWQPNWPRMIVASRGTTERNANRWFTRELLESTPTLWQPLPEPPASPLGGPNG